MNELSTKKIATINEMAEDRGKEWAKRKVSKTQVQSIYSEIKRAEREFSHAEITDTGDERGSADGEISPGADGALSALRLLQPKLAYQQSRDNNLETVSEFVTDEIEAISKHDNPEHRLVEFFHTMEATVAYYTYYEDKFGDS